MLLKLFLKLQIRTASSHIAVPKPVYHCSFFSFNFVTQVLHSTLLSKPFFSHLFCWILFCFLFLAFTSKVDGILPSLKPHAQPIPAWLKSTQLPAQWNL